MDKIPFTLSGLEKIKFELDDLKKSERPQVIQSLNLHTQGLCVVERSVS